MSYCRWGADSDVYVIASVSTTGTPGRGRRDCWICYCQDPSGLVYSREDMISHLAQHRERGDRVPESALDRLRREIAED